MGEQVIISPKSNSNVYHLIDDGEPKCSHLNKIEYEESRWYGGHSVTIEKVKGNETAKIERSVADKMDFSLCQRCKEPGPTVKEMKGELEEITGLELSTEYPNFMKEDVRKLLEWARDQ